MRNEEISLDICCLTLSCFDNKASHILQSWSFVKRSVYVSMLDFHRIRFLDVLSFLPSAKKTFYVIYY